MVSPVVPAIVIAAHNRPGELKQLLDSLERASIEPGTPLVISIDGGGSNQSQVRAVADLFAWPHGPRSVREHQHLGLVEHFYQCGDLTAEFGAVVLLEDDLIVGPGFQDWAAVALTHIQSDERIAGVSLAAPFYHGYRPVPFEPTLDGYDGVFAQIPWYDGMAWTAEMWRRYRGTTIDPATPIHQLLTTLGADEWFPSATQYLVQTNRYYLLPRHAHATNSGAAGAHFERATDYFQVPLTLRPTPDFRLASLDDSLARYDDHLELEAACVQQLVPELADRNILIDLLGTRDLTRTTATYVLTTRQVTSAEQSWGAALHPLIANLAHQIKGDAIHLARRDAVVTSDDSDTQALATLTNHANRGRSTSNRDALRQLTSGIRSRLRRGE